MGPAIVGISDLWLADNQGIPATLLAQAVSWTSWSPDGTKIAYIHEFVENEFIVSELWIVQADGKQPEKLLSGAHNMTWLDEQTVLFIDAETEQLQLVNIHNQKIVPFNIEGLSSEYSQIILYDLAADRQKLAFASRADTKVRIAELSNNQAKLVTEIDVPDLSRMEWSPDSNRLAFAPLCSKPDQNPACQQISIVQPDGSVITHIDHRPHTNVTWSPDGRWIAFQETNRVYVADAGTGQFKVLHTFPADSQNTTESVDWSPMGHQIGLNQDSSGSATLLSLQTTR
jgi:Tol biopolymer transport system component